MINKYVCKNAISYIKGGALYPKIKGYVLFQDVPGGTAVYVNITGLPEYQPAKGEQAPIGPHGFHIHELGNCNEGFSEEPFKDTGGHWNPTNQPHGNHAGDFPVLFSNNGKSIMSFFTNKFKVQDIIGKSIIIHENPDDYRSQPSGNSGKKIACGIISPYNWCMSYLW
ncbi:superoxide dismutase family protein [Clostridium tepidum]|uniref:Superoxide dismutase n=1 Tax=Clostridium tepidum TaxID=1962263 RepID=A0A1S9IG84_9CLOT|nr:superoxide dismutase family protein [Clostridium tepidum]MCR1934445.1 superoxide dismutase family protein [Clostridium tepidum]MDU6878054.1 superoxide dismutase family protein [Clostridium botulinum]OOO62365.1 superoxide dismutase [Clostridium tepidum]OOO69341.1 superoxide dismutase [Clostridium tepidum]